MGAPAARQHPCALHQEGWRDPPSPGPAAGWGFPTCSRCSIKLPLLLSCQFLIPGLQSAPLANGRAAAAEPREVLGAPGMSPMAFTALLLLLVLGAGMHAVITMETTETTTSDTTTTETTMTDTTTTETTTTDTTTTRTTTTDTTTTDTTTTPKTTMKTTTETSTTPKTTTNSTTEMITTPTTATLNVTISKNTGSIRTQTSVSSHTTVSPTTDTTTSFQTSNSSAGNTTANSTTVPVSTSTAISHTNATANSTNTTNSSSVVPTSPTSAGTVTPISSTKGNGSSSTQVTPTRKTSVTTQGSTAPRQTSTAVLGSSGGPKSTMVQLLLHVPLSFHILNRIFNESLRDPTSKDYRSLSHTVLAMFEHVFGCMNCKSRQSYKGCSELRFSQGSVEVQSTLVFGHGNDTITADIAEHLLQSSLNQSGFVMGLQLSSIQSTVEVMSPAPVVPGWAIALLVLVCILLLLSILTCLLMTTCTCRRKSQGKLDLFSTKDSYHPMAEYPPYQSHGRYVSPNSKPNPYSQVASSNGAGAGTFTYTNPAATSDNL